MTKFFLLFSLGGAGYCTIELLWRGHTHWTMFVLGGVCFYLLFNLFTSASSVPIVVKIILGGITVTAAEFLTGCLVNLLLHWNVWSYADIPHNFLGQICLLYSFLWTLLCIPIAFLCFVIKKYI